MSETKLPVSVCMLVKNEADRLPRSLPPLSSFAEVLVYDSGSEDGSIDLCERAGAVVHRGEWLGFSETRRVLFAKASQPWVFWLDADEVITEALLKEMQSVFSVNPVYAGFSINRIVHFEGQWIRHGDWFPDWNLRVFKSDAWELESRAVHEAVTVKGEIGRFRGLLEHYTYRDWQDQQARSEKYAALWAEEHASRKVSPGEGQLRAIWRWFKGYILKRGFLDGAIGAKIALANAREVALKYRLLQKKQSQ